MADAKDKSAPTSKKPASGILDELGNWITENPTLVGTLLGGGLGATSGYFLPDETDEGLGDEERLQARLKRALIFGGIGGVGGGALGYGLSQLGSSVDAKEPTYETKIQEGEEKIKKGWNALTHPATIGTGVGVAGTVGAHKFTNFLAASSGSKALGNIDDAKTAVNMIAKRIGDSKVSADLSRAGVLGTLENYIAQSRMANADPKLVDATREAVEWLGKGKGYDAGIRAARAMGMGGLRSPAVWGRMAGKGVVGTLLGLLAAFGVNSWFGGDDTNTNAE